MCVAEAVRVSKEGLWCCVRSCGFVCALLPLWGPFADEECTVLFLVVE